MKRWIGLALMAGLMACREGPGEDIAPVPEGPVDWEVSARTDKTEVQVGEALRLELTIRHPAGAEFLVATGANLAPFELVERIEEESDNPVESHITLRIGAYQLPAEIAIPPIKVEYRDESGELASIETESIPINLVTSLTPDVTDIHDIKDPIADLPVPSRWGNLWWLLAALLAALLAYYLYRRWQKRTGPEAEATPAPPPIAPELEAEEALRRLVAQRLLESGKVKEFYVGLSEIMKRYAGRRFNVPYLERTTSEIRGDLRGAGIPREPDTRLEKILVASDLVKFARAEPLGEESNRMVPESFQFIEQVRPKPPRPEAEL
jgi:hypothetical protein